MKGLLITMWGLFSLFLGQAQTSVNVPEPPYLKNPSLPPFRLLEVDSAHYVTKENVEKNRKVLIIF